MKALICLCSVLTVSTAAPQLYHGVRPAAGQTSHQSVSKADGEVRSSVVSKAFGSPVASVSQVDNSKGLAEVAPASGAVVNNGAVPVAAAAAPVVVAAAAAPVVAAPVVSPRVVAPLLARPPVVHHRPAVVHHAPAVVPHAPAVVHHAPAVVHHAPAVVHHAPAVVHHAPAVIAPRPAIHAVPKLAAGPAYPETPEAFAYEYGVADDYSKAAFNEAKSSDEAGNVAGSYSVALPDGRTQHVKYTADGYNGFVADVTYEGVPVYPEVKPYVPAPAPAYHA